VDLGKPLQGVGRVLYGNMLEQGASLTWHEFRASDRSAGACVFNPRSLGLYLNVAGQASLSCGDATISLEPMDSVLFTTGNAALELGRSEGQEHRFLTLQLSAEFLRSRLAECDGALHPMVERLLNGDARRARAGEVRPLTTQQEQFVTHLLEPPCPQAARPVWYQGQVLALIADFLFERPGEDELFCDRQKRVARERVERVIAVLRKHLAEPPTLEEIGRQVGSSPFYLSRTFSAQTGMTISQYLRKLRMQRAAELLRSGKYNVTEAAMEVGYSSMSHFSQAFCQTMGCCPGLYPLRSEVQTTPKKGSTI